MGSKYIIKKITEQSLELKHLIADFNSGRNLLRVAHRISQTYGKIQGLLLALSQLDAKAHKTISNALVDTMENAITTINKLL